MEAKQACSLFQFSSAAFWHIVALSKKGFEFNRPPYLENAWIFSHMQGR
jgi:hypothetical protein